MVQINAPASPTIDRGAPTTQAGTVMESIQSAVASLSDILQLIGQLQAESSDIRDAIRDQKGQKAAAKLANPNADVSSFDTAIGNLQGSLQNITNSLERAMGSLEKAEKKLNELNNRDLPAAQQKDVSDAQREADAAKSAAEATLEANAGAIGDGGGEAEDIEESEIIQQLDAQLAILEDAMSTMPAAPAPAAPAPTGVDNVVQSDGMAAPTAAPQTAQVTGRTIPTAGGSGLPL